MCVKRSFRSGPLRTVWRKKTTVEVTRYQRNNRRAAKVTAFLDLDFKYPQSQNPLLPWVLCSPWTAGQGARATSTTNAGNFSQAFEQGILLLSRYRKHMFLLREGKVNCLAAPELTSQQQGPQSSTCIKADALRACTKLPTAC